MRPEPAFDPLNPLARLELETALYNHVGALNAVAALFGATQSIDAKPSDFGCLVDILHRDALNIKKLAGF